ncbi:class I SAM-dependent methyltransferase [Streptomyces prasinopilosus]|uniref:class I SAM-dependent methyltransferase n=1 Tax=Streptomyces prasinopilosus TaxID=67344 RepID=UPI000AF32739|nr:class I SAM-dependent methyltransferase [Streptomyces prasinopilosus]
MTAPALFLAERGIEVIGVDPAGASLEVARAKPGGDRVRRVHCDVTALPPPRVDPATMTANVARAIIDPEAWRDTLRGAHTVLRSGGRPVSETRDPARRAWEEWNREESHRVTDVPGVGAVESRGGATEVGGPLVAFRWTYVLGADGQVLTSDSTLRFRERREVEADLDGSGLTVEGVRDAPGRPGRELVFVTRRPRTGGERSGGPTAAGVTPRRCGRGAGR